MAGKAFRDRDLGAVAVSLNFDVVCGCAAAPRGLQAPPVVVWDLSTGLVLREFSQGDLGAVVTVPPAPDEVQSGYRFAVGELVECFTSEGWRRGEVTQWDYREPDWPVGLSAPYQVRVRAPEALIYVPKDLPRLIRPAENWQAYESGEVDIQLAIHPTKRCIMLGLWQKSTGRVHCLEVGRSQLLFN